MIDKKNVRGFSQPARDALFGKTRLTGDGKDVPTAGGHVHVGIAKAAGD